MRYFNKSLLILLLLLSSRLSSQTLVSDPINGWAEQTITGNSSSVKYIDVDEDPTTGNKVFVWQEDPLGGTGAKDIFCAIYDVRSTLVNKFVVNKTTAGEQVYPRVKVNKNDQSFIVVWGSYINSTNAIDPNQYDVYAKKIRFASYSTDKLNPDLLINTYITGNQTLPLASFDYRNNEVIIAWTDQNGRDRLPTIVSADNGIYAKRINYSGATLALISGSDEFRINNAATAGHQTLTDMEISPVTGMLYCIGQYMNQPGGSGYDIILGTFSKNASGNYISGSETILNTTLSGDQVNPSLAINSLTGDIALSWQDNISPGNIGFDCFSKILDKNNVVKKDVFRPAPFGTNNNEFAAKIIWDEATGGLIYFFCYSDASISSIKYIVYNNNFVKVSNEQSAITRNLYNAYGAMLKISYDQSLRKAFLVYDGFNASNALISSGYFAQFKIAEPVTVNYVEKQTLFKEVKDADLLTGVPSNLAQINRSYIDGLGRPIQTITVQGSPSRKDIIQPIEYDSYGRVPKKYLPYTQNYNDAFKSDYLTAQANFYNDNSGNNKDNIPNDLFPFSEEVFDNSVYYKESETSSPGASYKLGSGHTVNSFKSFNNNSDAIRKWRIDDSGNAVSMVSYDINNLFVSKSVDVNGATTAKYIDKEGNLICTKTYPANCEDRSCMMETYYVYDVFKNKRFVITPQAVLELKTANTSTWTVNYNGTTNVDKLIFCSKYDNKQRVIERKAPDKAIQYLVYNKYDQVVLVQNGNQRLTNKWKFNKYDVLGRKIMSGEITDDRKINDIKAEIDSRPLIEKRDITSKTGYTNVAFPVVVSESAIYDIEYYDDYLVDFDNLSNTTQQYIPLGFSPEPIASSNVKGLLTGKKYRNLQNMSWLVEVNFYDKKGRLIQKQKNTQFNPLINCYTGVVYDFADRLLLSKSKNALGITVLNRFEYDKAGRVKNVFQKINSDAEVMLSQQNYNELGQLVEKNLHSEDGGQTFLQSVDYTYSILNTITHINNSTLTNSLTGNGGDNNNDTNDLFGMELIYEKVAPEISNTPVFGGSISAMKWKVNNPSTSVAAKAYRYSYDNLGRLSGGEFGAGSSTFLFGNTYNETGITYDMGGNIKTLKRFDQNGVLMDQLSYDYTGIGNQIKSITDQSANANGFNDRSSQTSEYTYDPNGNIKSDANKGIADIVYNHLNLPSIVYFGSTGSGNRIEFNYTSNADLISRAVYKNGTLSEIVEYSDGMCLRNNQLKFIGTQEGRAVPSGTGYAYQYNLVDHLGNVRVTFEKDANNKASIIQEDNYYPFGLKLPQLSYQMSNNGGLNDFLFNGKELQGGLDINNDLVNDYDWDVYHYGARFYDPEIGRWNGVEPLSDVYSGISSYAYALNRPASISDKAGLDPFFYGPAMDYSAQLALNMAIMVQSANLITSSLLRSMEMNVYSNLASWSSATAERIRMEIAKADAIIAESEVKYRATIEAINARFQAVESGIISGGGVGGGGKALSDADQAFETRLGEAYQKWKRGEKIDPALIDEFRKRYNLGENIYEAEKSVPTVNNNLFIDRDHSLSTKREYSRVYDQQYPFLENVVAPAGDALIPVVDNLLKGALKDYVLNDHRAAVEDYYDAADELIEFGAGLAVERYGTVMAEKVFEGAGMIGDANGFSITRTVKNWYEGR